MRLKRARTSLSASLSVLFAAACFGAGAAEAPMLAPGWGNLGYEPPRPGTYELPVIQSAAGGGVLKSDGRAADLSDFLHGKISVLSFIYTSCDDVNGCPLSIFVLHMLQDRFKKEPDLAADVRLISYSFDLKNDTPQVLSEFEKEHGGGHEGHAGHGGHEGHAGHEGGGKSRGAGAEWLFMVAKSQEELDPVLKAYSQFVIPEINEKHEKTGQFAHLLRVFLIDRQGRVRNIYSPSFLHPDILLADIKSLLLMDGES